MHSRLVIRNCFTDIDGYRKNEKYINRNSLLRCETEIVLNKVQ
jgi:hypothetical protein